jgi:hypothetical protein
MTDELFQVGDWVRFYQDARLVIAEVRYLTKATGGYLVLRTDRGEIRADYVVDYKR